MNHAGEISPDGFPIEMTGDGEKGAAMPPLKSLAIVGSHPATREKAPYENNSFEIWLFNEAPMKPEVYRRWDASFQIHAPEVYASDHNWVNKDHWKWLQQDHGERTIWMQDVDPRVPNSAKYPLDEILQEIPFRYLRSTPAMALALAIYLGYTDIWLYGSELSSNTEYTYQAINYAFWIGYALGKRATIHMECWQNEFNQPIYGYDGEVQLKSEYFQDRIGRHEIEYKAKRNAWEKTAAKLEKAFEKNDPDQVGELSMLVENLAYATGEMIGALDEAKRYAERENPISRQEFERRSAQAQKDGHAADGDVRHSAGKCEYVWNVWRMHGVAEAKSQLRTLLKEKEESALKAGKLLGIFNENFTYMHEYDRVVVAAGGQRATYQAVNNEQP